MSLGITDTATVTISVQGIELIALKKLALVSYALAEKLGGSAKKEQLVLVATLDALIRQIEFKAASHA